MNLQYDLITLKRGEMMDTDKNRALSGENNKRLNNMSPTNNEGTAAWSEIHKELPHSKVPIPSEGNVRDAKEWVDEGSRL